jgi:acyl-CoA thioesterase
VSGGFDLEWLGLEPVGDSRWAFEMTSPLTRGDGKLYGGTGAALLVATMEAATGRSALWSTVQFVGSAELGERVECRLDVLAGGRRTSQVRMTATAGDRLVLVGLGSAGALRDGAVEAQMPTMPAVPHPDDAEDWGGFRGHPGRPSGWTELADLRQATAAGSMWARFGSGPHTRATIGFVADMVPTSVVRAVGQMGGGTSLDNSMRFGRLVETDWVLLDMDPWLASGGYLHGGARIWSEDGTLLGVASQTASAITFPTEGDIARHFPR